MKDNIYNAHSRHHESNEIHSTAIIHDCVTLGKNNKIGAYTVIGGDGEIRGVNNFEGTVHIGNNNVITSHVTIQRPSNKSNQTLIGDNNMIMAHVHIGHDAIICSNCEISTGSIIGGYVIMFDHVKIKLNCTIRNRVRIYPHVTVGMGSVVVKDVPELQIVYGNPAVKKGDVDF